MPHFRHRKGKRLSVVCSQYLKPLQRFMNNKCMSTCSDPSFRSGHKYDLSSARSPYVMPIWYIYITKLHQKRHKKTRHWKLDQSNVEQNC